MNQRGQALIEATFLIVVLFGILGATAAFAQWFLIRQKLIIAVREAAMLYSSGRFKNLEVKRQVGEFLSQQQPKLDTNHFAISMGRHAGLQSVEFRLDEVAIRYRLSPFLTRFFTNQMEEKCVIKHAPHYGPEFQTLYGPAVPW